MKYEVRIDPKIHDDKILLKCQTFMDEKLLAAHHQVLETKDAMIREALQKLGWTTPEKTVENEKRIKELTAQVALLEEQLAHWGP